MNNIQVLDCTLRDGGYCNEWRFGFENANKITAGLLEANVEIIECGFITDHVVYDPDVTKFRTVEEAAKVIPENRKGGIFVAMINYGEYNIDALPPCDGTSVEGIRVAFHKKNLTEALELCRQIKEKGYLVFVQAMVSLSYSDEEFLDLIRQANSLKPYAFYIVDSFGMMKGKDLTRLFFMVEHNLDPEIRIGFHSHNNMQLAYSNARSLTTVQTNRDLIIDSAIYGMGRGAGNLNTINRDLIIDSAIYGMGRGAGNLNTELFIDYLNESAGKKYQLKPILRLIDGILNEFYQRNYWGYSLPNYISAAHNAHPNYASYLDDKKTLTVEDMNEIFDMMEDSRKVSYEKAYIEELYLHYMAKGKVQEDHKAELADKLAGKTILLIAPGKSSVEEKNKVVEFASRDDIIVVSVNHAYAESDPDFIFLSNLRRFKELEEIQRAKCIITSNISADDVYYQTKYKDLLNQEEAVSDNAGLMAIKFFGSQGVKTIYLAGFDGYSHNFRENYGNDELSFVMRNTVLDAMNAGMVKVLKDYQAHIEIKFLTTPKYITI